MWDRKNGQRTYVATPVELDLESPWSLEGHNGWILQAASEGFYSCFHHLYTHGVIHSNHSVYVGVMHVEGEGGGGGGGGGMAD